MGRRVVARLIVEDISVAGISLMVCFTKCYVNEVQMVVLEPRNVKAS